MNQNQQAQLNWNLACMTSSPFSILHFHAMTVRRTLQVKLLFLEQFIVGHEKRPKPLPANASM
jgi:hypothetical protein